MLLGAYRLLVRDAVLPWLDIEGSGRLVYQSEPVVRGLPTPRYLISVCGYRSESVRGRIGIDLDEKLRYAPPRPQIRISLPGSRGVGGDAT